MDLFLKMPVFFFCLGEVSPPLSQPASAEAYGSAAVLLLFDVLTLRVACRPPGKISSPPAHGRLRPSPLGLAGVLQGVSLSADVVGFDVRAAFSYPPFGSTPGVARTA